jgi:hypothetical protein
MAASAGRYVRVVMFRVVLAVVSILIAARAGHQNGGAGPVWLLASMLAVGGAACLLWPLVVPARHRAMSVYSVAPAFFLAGMFLLPPAPLVLLIAFAIALVGVVQGTRAYRVVFHLSSSIVVFGGFALALDLGPRPSDFMFQPAPRAGLEFLISAAALTALLIVRSVALRLEQGEEAPHWGAFQGPALVEGVLCLVFASTIMVLARIHLAFLAVVAVEIAMIWWFLHRYAIYAEERRTMPEAGIERRRARPAPSGRRASITRLPRHRPGGSELEPAAAETLPESEGTGALAAGAEEPREEDEGEEPWRTGRSRRR